MKKFLFGIFLLSIFSVSNVFAKKLTFCYSYFAGPSDKMKCKGDLEGKYSPLELYRKGWTLKTDISGGNQFILVFEK